jgi:hypothetical protein
MRIVVDIDGTICSITNGNYELASPFSDRIQKFNDLFRDGNQIVYFTARGSSTGKNWRDITLKQLNIWGALYTEVIFGKPAGDLYIDDKGINSEDYFLKI